MLYISADTKLEILSNSQQLIIILQYTLSNRVAAGGVLQTTDARSGGKLILLRIHLTV
jgi:hypothetical protein